MSTEAPTAVGTICNFDTAHTSIDFKVKHMMVTSVRGSFKEFTGQIIGDLENPTTAEIDVQINAASIDTNNEQRDKDLRASNFLEVDKFPTMTFKSTKIEPAGPELYTLTGDLTIKGHTRPVTLKVVKYGEFNDPNMGHRIGYAAEGEINRKDFGMTFEMMLDGKWIVSNEIQINIEGELLEAKESETAQ